jgi:hypothetical protein
LTKFNVDNDKNIKLKTEENFFAIIKKKANFFQSDLWKIKAISPEIKKKEILTTFTSKIY